MARTFENLPTIGDAFTTGRNSFDLLRLFAAMLVIFEHSYVLLGVAHLDPLGSWYAGNPGRGSLAVALFFVLSGFLVTGSLERSPINRYVRARALRIMPAFAAVVLLQALVLGPLLTTLTPHDYFHSKETRESLRGVFLWNLKFTLPGVFKSNQMDAVNGSLWTLPAEATLYLLLPLVMFFGLLRPRWVWLPFVFLLLFRAHPGLFGMSEAVKQSLVFKMVPVGASLEWALCFAAGVVAWVHRDRIPLSGALAVCSAVLLYASAYSASAPWVFAIAFPYLVLYVGLAHPFGKAWREKVGDLSYGTYLYGFPVQQTLIAVGVATPTAVTLTALPLVLVLAAISWRLIESPALRWKRKPGASAPVLRTVEQTKKAA